VPAIAWQVVDTTPHSDRCTGMHGLPVGTRNNPPPLRVRVRYCQFCVPGCEHVFSGCCLCCVGLCPSGAYRN